MFAEYACILHPFHQGSFHLPCLTTTRAFPGAINIEVVHAHLSEGMLETHLLGSTGMLLELAGAKVATCLWVLVCVCCDTHCQECCIRSTPVLVTASSCNGVGRHAPSVTCHRWPCAIVWTLDKVNATAGCQDFLVSCAAVCVVASWWGLCSEKVGCRRSCCDDVEHLMQCTHCSAAASRHAVSRHDCTASSIWVWCLSLHFVSESWPPPCCNACRAALFGCSAEHVWCLGLVNSSLVAQ